MRFARFVSLVEILKRSNIKINSLEKFAGNFYINMSQTLLSTIDLMLDRYEDYSRELLENENIPSRVDSYEIPIEDFFHEKHMEFVSKVFPEAKKVRFYARFSKTDGSDNLGFASITRNDQMAEVVELCEIQIFAGRNRHQALRTIYHELTHCAQYISGSAGYWANHTIHPEESGGNTQFNNKSFGMPHSTRKKFRSRNRKIQEILVESFYEHDLSTEKYVILVQDGRYLIFLSKENPSGYDSDEDQQNRFDVLKLLCVRGGDGEFISKPGNYYNKDSEKRYEIRHELRSIENFTNASTYCQIKFAEILNMFKDFYIKFKIYRNRLNYTGKVIQHFLQTVKREFLVNRFSAPSEISKLIRDIETILFRIPMSADIKVEYPEKYQKMKNIFSRIISHILVYQDSTSLLKITKDENFSTFQNQDFANQFKEKLKEAFKPLVDKRISHVVEESKIFAENMFEYINSEVTGDSSFEDSADPYSKMIIDNIIKERKDRDDELKLSIVRERERAREIRRERIHGEEKYESGKTREEKRREMRRMILERERRRGRELSQLERQLLDDRPRYWSYQRPGIPEPDSGESNK
jgi:hypothetical protein